MDFAVKKAHSVIRNYLEYGAPQPNEIIEKIQDDLYVLDEEDEKIKYLNIILEKNNTDYEEHLKECKEPETCSRNEKYEHVAYFIVKELKSYGIRFNDDTFTKEEKNTADEKLDKVLAELNEIKLSQRVVYEGLAQEIEELKNLYYLGKKKWYQLLVGKSFDMAISGIVSETVSKDIIEQFRKNLMPLLNS